MNMRVKLLCACAMLLVYGSLAHAQAPAQRSALVVGVSQYAAHTQAATLAGVPYDMDSARRIALAMGIPASQIRYIRDQEGTKDNILRALRQMGENSGSGARNFIYFSGHGTRYWDPASGSCVEGLLTHDGQVISNAELAEASRKSTEAADKVLTLIDACHSGGLNDSKGTRSLSASILQPKFSAKNSSIAEQCSKPSNMRTRGLFSETLRLGALQENVVVITSSRPDEVSFDEPGKGGLATQALRDCLLGQAQDSDGSGAVSLAEVQQCAQQQINSKLQGLSDLSPHHVTVTGNRNLVPVPASRPPPASAVVAMPSAPPTAPVAAAPVTVPVASPVASPVATAPVASPGPPAAVVKPPSLTPEPVKPPVAQTASATASTPALAAAPQVPPALASLATLRDIEQQRDPRIRLDVKLSKDTLRIGKDALELTVKSSHAGYIYLVMLGSDRKSFYVLYPNGLDRDNRIAAGQSRTLPRPDWQLQAAGPPGLDHLLVMVTMSPRQLDARSLAAPDAANPFTYALNDLGGRAALIDYLVHATAQQESTRFGAQLLTLREVP